MAARFLYRETWAEIPAERPITQRHVAHPDLELALHGPGAAELKKSHHADVPGDPYYVWSGKCAGAWALSLRHRGWLVGARDGARVILRTRQSGPRHLSVIAKPVDGDWLVSDESIGATADWRDHALDLAALRWRTLDIARVAAGAAVAAPDLARLDALGVTDLSAGGDSGACSRVGAIEVWGEAVARV